MIVQNTRMFSEMLIDAKTVLTGWVGFGIMRAKKAFSVGLNRAAPRQAFKI